MRPFFSWTIAAGVHITLLAALAAYGVLGLPTGGEDSQDDGVRAAIVPDPARDTISRPEETTPTVAHADVELPAPVVAVAPVAQVSALPASGDAKPVRIIGIGQACGEQVQGEWGRIAIGASGGRSGSGVTSFLGIRAEGKSFVYIVDRSGSMSGAPLVEAKRELLASIDKLRRHHQFFVFFYDSVTTPMPTEGMVKANERNKQACAQWVRTLNSQGGTLPEEALLAALRMKPDIIFFMSDGIFSADVCDRVKAAQSRPPVTIHTAAFLSRRGEPVLMRLAEENAGTYRFFPGGSASP